MSWSRTPKSRRPALADATDVILDIVERLGIDRAWIETVPGKGYRLVDPTAPRVEESVSFGDLTLYETTPGSGEVVIHGRSGRIPVSGNNYAVLRRLISAQGRPVPYTEIGDMTGNTPASQAVTNLIGVIGSGFIYRGVGGLVGLVLGRVRGWISGLGSRLGSRLGLGCWWVWVLVRVWGRVCPAGWLPVMTV